jgi:ABC-2 type transport system permease protein
MRLLRAELLKQRSTRTSLVLMLSMLGLIVAIVALHVFSLSVEDLAPRDNQLKVLGWGTSLGALFAALLGAMSITGEIRHGMIRPTLLATPRRRRVIAAKVGASALAGLLVGLLAQALTAGVVSAGLAACDVEITVTAGDFAQLLAGGAVAASLFAAIGVGVGALVRNQVGVVVGLCVWLLLVESVLIGDVPSVGQFAPGASAGALAGALQDVGPADLIAPALGALLLVAYAAAAFAAGSIVTERRDIG